MKVGFVLLSNSARPIPSTRIAVLNILPFLQQSGFDVELVFDPEAASETPDVSGLGARIIAAGCDLVVLQKVHGASVVALVQQLAAAGIKTVYTVCDGVNVSMAQATDATIVVTDYLKSLYPQHLHPKIHVVHDGIEDPDVRNESGRTDRGSRSNPLRAVLITSARLERIPYIGTPPSWLEISVIGRYPERRRGLDRARAALRTLADQPAWPERVESLRFMTSPGVRCLPWSHECVVESLRKADIGIIPIDDQVTHQAGSLPPFWKRKSENRLTLKMCAALPVIATPIPAYEAIIEQGVNGYLASTRADWRDIFDKLRDPGIRAQVGFEARAAVIHKFSIEEQGRKFVRVLNDVLAGERAST